jgi:integrase
MQRFLRFSEIVNTKATFQRVLAATAIEAKDGQPEIPPFKGGPHKLRHSFASNFLAKKPDLYLLSKPLGHSSFKVTERCYAHLVPGYLDAGRNIVTATIPEMLPEAPKLRRVK